MTLEVVAMMEEDPVYWVERPAGSSPFEAVQAVRAGWSSAVERYEVKVRSMRPFEEKDCDGSRHDLNEYGDPVDDECTCRWKGDIGWKVECQPNEPGAFPVWRVEVE